MASTGDDNHPSPALYEKVPLKDGSKRAVKAVTLSSHGGVWMVAMACESWFTFLWVLTLSTKWNPGTFKTYPQRLFEG
ncbi:hypothetical protein MLD38_025793 [Melastoma candidum]|uniref:Uncharacterized protein n=1 Tax=Melastoma candidum TaxID=119954 RepID=A0ACB9NY38_9MYRT|nr:hypothetical protein MLD38_025793 [Melastoma candidum]